MEDRTAIFRNKKNFEPKVLNKTYLKNWLGWVGGYDMPKTAKQSSE